MANGPIKIRDLSGRLPEAGRIRAGKKASTSSGGTKPVALRNFRFTSTDRASIEQVAKLYGGDVHPWTDPLAAPGQFEVITEANEIAVALPPQPLSEMVYELWSGGGCQRRCDGETVTLARGGGPDGGDPVERDCLCAARGVLECKLTTRLSVLLPEIRFLGTWRLDTKGVNAAMELPGMVAGIQAIHDRQGFVRAVLRLEQRMVRKEGQPVKRFVVPVLGLDSTPDELASGGAQLGSAAALPALDAPASCPGCTSVFEPHWENCPALGLADDIVSGTEDRPDVIDVEPVDAPIVLTESAGGGEYNNPDLDQAWRDALTTSQQAKYLSLARISQRARKEPQSTRFDEIPDDLLRELSKNGTP